jgi:MFS family permease
MTPPSTVRRLVWLLFFSTSLGSAGYIAGNTIAAIVGDSLSQAKGLAGLPGAIYMLGGALASYPAARFMERIGRRLGLSLGFIIGIMGSLLAGAAVITASFPLFLFGLALMGASRAAGDLGRYAAAEMHLTAERGRAISRVVLGGTVGAVLGPAIVGPMGELAKSLGAPELAGPWFASAALFALGSLLLFLFLSPDPRDIGRTLAAHEASQQIEIAPTRGWGELLRLPAVQTALAAMVLGQAVMVMLMSMTALHMRGHQHGLGDISIVISLHTLGMFGPSIFSGQLVDRWGRAPVIGAGAALTIVSCLLAPLSTDTWVIGAALLLLGLGWNFCYVAGAALLTDALTPAERSQGQGSTDLLINLISASGSLSSGLLFASAGYALIAWVGLGLTLIPLALAVSLAARQKRRASLSAV